MEPITAGIFILTLGKGIFDIIMGGQVKRQNNSEFNLFFDSSQAALDDMVEDVQNTYDEAVGSALVQASLANVSMESVAAASAVAEIKSGAVSENVGVMSEAQYLESRGYGAADTHTAAYLAREDYREKYLPGAEARELAADSAALGVRGSDTLGNVIASGGDDAIRDVGRGLNNFSFAVRGAIQARDKANDQVTAAQYGAFFDMLDAGLDFSGQLNTTTNGYVDTQNLATAPTYEMSGGRRANTVTITD
jgi:hypothetical protein